MKIIVEEFTLVVTEMELFDILFSIRDTLRNALPEARKYGIQSFIDNSKSRLEMMKKFSYRLDRPDIYNDFMEYTKNYFKE